jgi:FkbM family methyltransferase
MISREIFHLENFLSSMKNRKIAIYCAGNYAQKFYKTLTTNYGANIEFFIDRNPKADSVLGVPVCKSPWSEDENFKDDFFVIVSSSGKNFSEISPILRENKIPHISSDAYEIIKTKADIFETVKLLEDEESRLSFLGVIYYWLTYDNRYIQTVPNQYFAHKEFAHPINEIICEAGAYTGDNTEQYIVNSLGTCRIYAFEPDPENINSFKNRMKRVTAENNYRKEIVINQMALSDKTGVAYFENNGSSGLIKDSGIEVKTTSIDDYFTDITPTLIKADIEGAEVMMLRGAGGGNIFQKTEACIMYLSQHKAVHRNSADG